MDFDVLMEWYAAALLGQLPCMRMTDTAGRKQLVNDPHLKAVIYHTVKFCDYYGFEYSHLRRELTQPMLKLESDYTVQSSGQLLTRLEAFAESMSPAVQTSERKKKMNGKGLYVGIDSGSTSTDVVILNEEQEIVSQVILPTGAGAAAGADRALEEALRQANLTREDLTAIVTTGYGRTAIQSGDKSITEITCHARGAFFLNPNVRTIIDIGGQDSKVIRIDDTGNVTNFVMNDKCAAGTGRFLDVMARVLEVKVEDLGTLGAQSTKTVEISSTCTVFAESEVISQLSMGTDKRDIINGIHHSVAARVTGLAHRVGIRDQVVMTGGVAQNSGVVKALEESLGHEVHISPLTQYNGALGAALFAYQKYQKAQKA